MRAEAEYPEAVAARIPLASVVENVLRIEVSALFRGDRTYRLNRRDPCAGASLAESEAYWLDQMWLNQGHPTAGG